MKQIKQVTQISIPVGLSRYLVLDNTMMSNTCFFFKLKALYVGGVILNYKSQYLDIRNINQFVVNDCDLRTPSEQWVKKHIKNLLALGWVTLDGNNLTIQATKKVFRTHEFWSENSEIVVAKTRVLKVPCGDLYMLEEILIADALDQNKKQQEKVIIDKIVKNELKEKGIFIASEQKLNQANKNIISRLTKHINENFDNYITKYGSRFFSNLSKFNFKDLINPVAFSSRSVLAKLKSVTYQQAKNIFNKLKKLGLLFDEKRNYINTKHQVYDSSIFNYMSEAGLSGFIGRNQCLYINLPSFISIKTYYKY
jgi:hypothetical protein